MWQVPPPNAERFPRVREGWGLCITPESALSPMPGAVFFLLAIFGSFLCCFNSPAAPAADEIWAQKKRVVFDAPGLGCVVLLFMDFFLFLFTSKLYPKFTGKGRERMS